MELIAKLVELQMQKKKKSFLFLLMLCKIKWFTFYGDKTSLTTRRGWSKQLKYFPL